MNFQTANPNPVTSIAYSGCRLTFYIQFVWLQGLFLVLSMSRKRRAPASFEWQTVPENADEPLPQPDIRIRHSHFNLDQSGPSSSRTSYLSAPASPSKKAGPLNYDYDDYNWNNEPVPTETNATNHAFHDHDPAYLHFLDVNEPGPPRRPRTVEVRVIIQM
jgi:hypothetical protein